MTLAYILFVQPVVMNAAGMDLESALLATCTASALATFVMGLIANDPIALAPAMGPQYFLPPLLHWPINEQPVARLAWTGESS